MLLAVGCTAGCSAGSNRGSQLDAGVAALDASDATIAPTADAAPDSSPDAEPGSCDPEHGICRYGGMACPCPPPSGCGHPGQPCCVGYVFYFDQCDPAQGVQCSGGTCRADGMPCTSDASCASGVCFKMPSGDRCSSPCITDAQCVAGWTCLALADAASSNVCHCTPSTETGNGKDDDCDGLIDEASAQE